MTKGAASEKPSAKAGATRAVPQAATSAAGTGRPIGRIS